MVDLTLVGMAVVTALAYVLYGVLRAKSNGLPLDASRIPAVVVAAVFLALVAPELIPTAPEDVFTLPMIALTAFATFGALFVFQRLYEVGVAVFNKIKDVLWRLQNPDASMKPKARARKPKPKPQQTPP